MYQTKEYTINDITVPFKCEDCIRLRSEKPPIIPNPQYILYVYATSKCNATCEFCSERNYNRENEPFQPELLEKDLLLLTEQNLLKKISITGGEPFLDIKRLNSIVNTIFETLPNIDLSITTNGSFINRVYELDNLDKISQIHISRHHHNQEIIKTASIEDLQRIQKELSPGTLSFNCCLIDGYIDSYEGIKMYTETLAKQTGISTFGFISLMGDSEYCRANKVDFSKIRYKLITSEDTRVKDWLYSGDYCKCLVWDQVVDPEVITTSYWWEICENKSDIGRQFIYTPDNHLTVNFNTIADLG